MIMPIYGNYPKIHEDSFVSDNAAVIGNVTIGHNASIWDFVSVRGDVEPIIIGENTNIQDNTSIHVSKGFGVIIGDNVTVGHNVVLHGCNIGNNTVIGSGSIILDGAKIGDNCIIEAGTVIAQGIEIPECSVAAGNPGVVKRNITSEEIEGNLRKASDFVEQNKKVMSPITVKDLRNNPEIKILMKMVENQLDAKGYTEHSYRHVGLTARNASEILKKLGMGKRDCELAEIAGFLHDIGNAVNRVDHAHSGGIIAYNILTKMGMPVKEAAEIMLAISNHDEKTGAPVSNISAALILADKSDVHRSRVKNRDFSTFDIHDRVNYAVISSELDIDNNAKEAILNLNIDIEICPVMDYFEIFLDRMAMCRKAAEYLGLKFRLIINDSNLL